LLLALLLLYRLIGSKHTLARPLFWLVAAYFPPGFADMIAGQRGGILLILAMASIWLEARRPAVAGIMGGLAAALKYYPAAMIIGPRPKHRIVYALVLAVVVIAATAIAFIPLGVGGTLFYYQHVLIPSLASHNQDCSYDSVRTLFMRTVGGEPYALPSATGLVLVTSPVHLPGVALFLSYASALLFAGGAAWGAWRSRWNPAYGMSLGFGLGALIPNEVWPYQWLPLLPLVLLVLVRGIERRRFVTLALLAVCLLCFYREPCDLPFPNLWTIGAIGVFALGVWENRLFRTDAGAGLGGNDGAQL
jgi:hypothetical protein